jgi:hypothetical protein
VEIPTSGEKKEVAFGEKRGRIFNLENYFKPQSHEEREERILCPAG